MSDRPKPVFLCILDGWGHREEVDHNAIAAANTPNWYHLLATYPHGVINASEGEVGLPAGQMGNSEVGHMNIGAGRIVMQDLPRIDTAIADGSLATNTELQHFITKLKQSGGTCHLLGLMSDGGVHAHQEHMAALACIVADAGVPVRIHAFLDGRDTPPRSALGYLRQLEVSLGAHENISISTLCGRYFAMDRDKRWDRVAKACNLLVNGEGEQAATAGTAIETAYGTHNANDEFVPPFVIGGYAGMQDGDGLLMANFRADRAREILTALLDPAFDGFVRKRTPNFAATLGMVEYSDALTPLIPAIFPQQSLTDILGEVVANAGMKQLRVAETEKYAHVTFFFNGGVETPFAGEDRILIPSPDVATYDLKPEMSAPEVTDALVAAIESGTYDLIVANYANTDMVGHSGDMNAAIQAVEAVDHCIGRLLKAIEAAGGVMLITADHGNAEQMHDHTTSQSHTAHTLNLVPLVVVGTQYRNATLPIPTGRLADIAPTVLQFLALPQPAAMTGTPLLSAEKGSHAVRA